MTLDPDKFEYDMLPPSILPTEEVEFELYHFLGITEMEDPAEQARFDAWVAANKK